MTGWRRFPCSGGACKESNEHERKDSLNGKDVSVVAAIQRFCGELLAVTEGDLKVTLVLKSRS